ncbi:MAG: hypothetical protein PWP31_323 [Clostridia bacterium]|nr:hypothetical protein [Clostridia bacterium]
MYTVNISGISRSESMNLKGKKILVTGAAGFIGSHLAEELVKKGAKVRALVRYNSKNNWGWLETSKFLDEIEIYMGDLRDYDSVKDAMKDVEIVFHLGALIGIPYSYISPLAYIRTNVEGTYNVLQSARDNVQRVVVTSTSEVYGTAQYTPIDEKHPLHPQSPYAATKVSADQLALSFYRSFDLPVSIIRPFNTYGPRQSARAIIPTIISQALTGDILKLGSLEPVRDLTYVLDTVSGFIEVGLSDTAVGQVINIGANEVVSIGDLVKIVSKLLDKELLVETDPKRVRPKKSEVMKLVCDNTKALENGWKPRYSLKDGLLETINWINDNIECFKPYIYNV